ncbi:zinc finger protein 846-like isoform X1 [Nymphalis io]|uniref:zinc finger protein 846-like isoform X1 n=1 Tax=Inachis io TaxID=171585 RepID=UPI00216715AD|nr:zinc finger protein 846-like isoform X1 [Nymphalis io]
MALQNSIFKIEDLCRTCLSKEIEMLSVFEIRLGTITLDSIIASITGIKIEHGDGLPSTICNMCKEKATNAYEFKARTQEADIQLRGLLKRENTAQMNNDNSLAFESEAVEVKTEQFARENHDDYMDIDLSLALSNVSETFNNVDTVKNEAEDHCKDIFTAQPTQNENLISGIKKKSFIIDGNETDSTYCPVCGSSFHDAEGLTKHAWEQHADLMGPKKRGRPKKLLTSTILNKLSENGYNLKYLPDQKHSCVFCKEDFKTKDDLVTHLVQHKDVKVLNCLLCKKIYLEMKDFDRHNCVQTSDELNNLKPAEPPDVPKEERKVNLSTEVLLQDLLMTNRDAESGGIDLCEECGAVFISSVELGKHRDREHPELSSRCHLCDKVFATVKSAARHRAVCARVERSFACASCGLRFAHEVSLNKHILRAHTGQSVSVRFMDRDRAPPQHRCDTCNRRFYRKDLLARHAKIHKSIEKCFECDVCNKKFHRRDNLRAHMRVHESTGAGVDGTSSSASLCLYCGRSFSNSSNLIVHMRRHTGEKPYKCDFCGKGFPRSSDLQCHRRSHTGEKPCICGVCGKAFARSNKLSRHMRVHTGMKPYKCPYCEKAFSQSNDLKLHVRRHTGDKPYVCELCGDRFIQGTALHNHRRAHGHFPTASAPPLAPIVYTVQSITQTH